MSLYKIGAGSKKRGQSKTYPLAKTTVLTCPLLGWHQLLILPYHCVYPFQGNTIMTGQIEINELIATAVVTTLTTTLLTPWIFAAGRTWFFLLLKNKPSTNIGWPPIFAWQSNHLNLDASSTPLNNNRDYRTNHDFFFFKTCHSLLPPCVVDPGTKKLRSKTLP